MTNAEYHKRPEISKSGLDLINRSPRHYWDRYLNPKRKEKDPTPALILGSVVHDLVFNQQEYIREPNINKRTKKGKAALSKFDPQDKIPVSSSIWLEACKIAQSVLSHPTAAKLIREGHAEQPIFEEINGADVRIKPDWLNDQYQLCVDLKTTTDASPKAFAHSAFKYRYHVQDAFYTDVLNKAGFKINGFVFIVVEKAPPYNVAIYQLGDEERELGRQEYLDDLETYKQCKASNEWQGYSPDINILNFPSYYLK